MVKCYAQEKQVFDINKVTVVGSPTITEDGVASGFLKDTTTGYDTTKTCIQTNGFTLGQLKDKPYKIVCEFELRDLLLYSLGYTFPWQAWSNCLFVQDSKVVVPARFGTSEKNTGNIQAVGWVTFDSLGLVYGNHYIYEVSFDGVSLYTFKLKNIDGSIIKSWTYTPTSEDKNLYEVNLYPDEGIQVGTCCIAYSNRWSGYKGQIDLTAFKIYVDGELVYSPTKPTYYLERRKEGFDLSKFTVVGTPTITEDGVYTCGNDKASYVKVPFDNTLDSFSLDVEINIQNSSQFGYYLGHSNNITYGFIDANFNGTGATDFRIRVKDNDGNISTLSMGAVKYQVGINKINLIFTGTYYLLTRTEANGTITTSKLETTNKPATNFFSLGNSNKADVALTTIDLTKITVTVDGKEVFTGAKEKFYAMQGGM